MKTCEARRKVARCEATKALNVLRSLEIAEDVKRQITIVEYRQKDLRIAEEEYRSLLTDDGDWEKVWTKASGYEEQFVSALHDARQRINQRSEEQKRPSTPTRPVDLPRIKLPEFGGDPLLWRSFWAQFQAAV